MTRNEVQIHCTINEKKSEKLKQIFISCYEKEPKGASRSLKTPKLNCTLSDVASPSKSNLLLM